MFGGGGTNPYDEIVSEYQRSLSVFKSNDLDDAAKTTDENLTSENWELIINCCDKVQEEGQEGYAILWLIIVALSIMLTRAILQGSRCHCGHTQATSTPQSKRPAVRIVFGRVSAEERRNRGKSRDSIEGVHTGP
jgi:hypothetical protein